MKLNRSQAIELHNALAQKGLKAKHISGGDFIKLLNIKTDLKNSLNTLSEAEAQLADEFGAIQNELGYYVEDKDKNKDFIKNLKEKQKHYEIELELNFISQMELKDYCKEQDTAIEAVLFEYLMKKE